MSKGEICLVRRNRKIRKINIILMYSVLIALIIVMTVQTSKLTAQTRTLEDREKMIDASIAEQENEKLSLQDEIDFINTREYIEEQAREKLGLLYPNETIIKEKH
ncbi:MAG: Septum formation initiator [Clostridiales bacterium]|jgi:cell division protein DivIC|nr:Septum formation initiator [Bacillales bacterium]MDF2820389.1 Septum formation initiator [Clostridiales bacterium]